MTVAVAIFAVATVAVATVAVAIFAVAIFAATTAATEFANGKKARYLRDIWGAILKQKRRGCIQPRLVAYKTLLAFFE